MNEFTRLLEVYAPEESTILVRLLAKAAPLNPSARTRLLELSTDPRITVVRQVVRLLKQTNAARVWAEPVDFRGLLLASDVGVRLGALELLRDALSTPPHSDLAWQERTDGLMAALLAIHPTTIGVGRTEGKDAERSLDLESRLLSACHGWLRYSAKDSSNQPAGLLLHERLLSLVADPPNDAGLRRSLLLLLMQTSWRAEHETWQRRCVVYLDEALHRISPDEVDEGRRSVRDAWGRLLESRIVSLPELAAKAENWTEAARGVLLALVLDRDPLGPHGPVVRHILEYDRGGYLASIVAEWSRTGS